MARILLEAAHKLRHPSFERTLLFHSGEIADYLAPQCGRHLAECGLRFRRLTQGKQQGWRQRRLARILIATDGNLNQISRIHPLLPANVAVNRKSETPFTARHERAPQRDALYFARNRYMGRPTADRPRHIGRHIHKTDETYFVNLAGEHVYAVHFAGIIPQSNRLWANREVQRDRT